MATAPRIYKKSWKENPSSENPKICYTSKNKGKFTKILEGSSIYRLLKKSNVQRLIIIPKIITNIHS
jgi:hypothetical protein